MKFLLVHLCLPSSNIHLFLYGYSHVGWLGLGIIPWGHITKGHCILEIRIKSKEVYLFSEVISLNWVMSLSFSPEICELETYFKKWEYCKPEASRRCSFNETLTLQELRHTLPKGFSGHISPNSQLVCDYVNVIFLAHIFLWLGKMRLLVNKPCFVVSLKTQVMNCLQRRVLLICRLTLIIWKGFQPSLVLANQAGGDGDAKDRCKEKDGSCTYAV